MSYFPNLTGKVDPEVEKAITALYQAHYSSVQTLDGVKAITDNLNVPGRPSHQFFHPEDRAYLQNVFQANGTHPVNVTNLLGILAQPQEAKTSVNINSTGAPINIPNAVNGQLQIVNGEIFFFTAFPPPGFWTPISAEAVVTQDVYLNWTMSNFDPGPLPLGSLFFIDDWKVTYITQSISGTNTWVYAWGVFISLAANRPTTGFNGMPLGLNDTNLTFIASDTGAYEYWDGAAWITLFGSSLTQTITTPIVTLQIGGASTGITQVSTCSCVQTGKVALLSIEVTLTNKGVLTGAVTIATSGIPVPALSGTGIVGDLMNMSALASPVDAFLGAGTSTIILEQTGPTGSVALADTNLTNTTSFQMTLEYQTT